MSRFESADPLSPAASNGAWPARIFVPAAVYSFLVGTSALVGWAMDAPRLAEWKNDGIAMFPNAAVCSMAAAAAILLGNFSSGRGMRAAVRVIAAFTAVVGGFTLIEHLTGTDLGIDALLFSRPWGQVAAAAPMRMGPPASLSFSLIGLAVVLSTFGRAGRRTSVASACCALAVGTVSLTGHLYGASLMYTLPWLTGIAMPTASVIVALAIAVVATVPEHEPMRMLLENSAAGVLVRRAVPLMIAVSMILGLLRIELERRQLIDPVFGTALRTDVEMLLVATLLWWAARHVRIFERLGRQTEAEVRRQSAQLAAFLDTAVIALHRVGPDGTILWANDAELRTLGYSRDEYVGRHIAEFHVDADVIADILARLHRGERLHDQPARMRRRDGTIRDVIIDSSVLWEEGRFVHTQCFTRDVTQQRKAEATQALLAAIVGASDDAIISKTLDGIITSWNAGAERLFGYTSDEAVGRSITMLIPADRQEEEPAILDRIRRGDRIEHYETVRQHRDGTLLDISLTVSPIRNDCGRITGASSIARDVTLQNRAAKRVAADYEATVRLHELGKSCVRPGDHFDENLGEILDTAIWISRADKGNVQMYDQAAEELRIVASRGFDLAFLEAFARVAFDARSPYGAALAAGERTIVDDVTNAELFASPQSLEKLRQAGIGAFQSTPLVSSTGTVLGIISTHFAGRHRPSERECRLLDVLARQAADYLERRRGDQQREHLLHVAERARVEAEAANRAKDEFLAMLGHELRNPLAAVQNAIAAAALDERSRERALEIARRQSDQLRRIVDDLLDVARITRGTVPIRKQRVSLPEVLQRAVEAAAGLMQERGHVLAFTSPANAIHVDGDASRLEQAFGNLLANSAKYTDPGGTVSVGVELDDDTAVVRVRDNGIGIAPDALSRVFDLFAQGTRTLDRAQGGLGIGLTVVRRIVELHDGTVEAHSAGVGHGSEFIVRLPTVAATSTTASSESTAAEVSALRRPARVLMVEDNPDAAESLGMILQLLGHHVRVAPDAVAALQAIRANPPDIMLIDIGLPGMDGYELASRIRADAAMKHLLLVALTGYGQLEDKARAMAAGFDYHLVKPIDVGTLTELVGRLGAQAPVGSPTRH